MYHIVGLILFTALIISVYQPELENNRTLLFVFIAMLFVMAAIRLEIGTDYPTYNTFFENVKPFSLHPDYSSGFQHYEPLFQYSTAILKHVIDSPIFFFSLWAFISLVFLWKGILDQSPNYLLSIFIYYCLIYINYTYNGIRQGVAMTIFIFSLKYILAKKLLPVLALTLFAVLIHSSGFLILAAYFMSFTNFKNRLIIFLVLLAAFITWQIGTGEALFLFIMEKIGVVTPDIVMYVKLFLEPHTLVQVLQRVLILIPLVWLYPRLSSDEKYRRLFSIYIWGTIIYLTFGFFSMFITRINMFFRVLEIILIPMLYEKIPSRSQKMVVNYLVMIWGFIVLTWVYYKEAYYPFKTIFGDIL
ncbi:MAG: EpsG family protein [Candidatus Marinimicrobia bacterium]|nr:EpsG family protein [Candidatus Neomarinimicrobiota bacterium]